ncbi:substrate-binding domain-containing protein [Luteolibacter sp. LG18]|uniref:substrate-binding domain-containing protein n=1 Tax=Luteolibacter sp. LG18 TaxID=2819286 RepID=UPI002B2C5E62|nr:hypothetical protein llg_41570 [Luteolibacter sp. LG18]
MTLRKALSELAREQWISLGGRGRLHRIEQATVRAPSGQGRTIRVLTPYTFAGLGTTGHVILETVAEQVSASGFRLEIEHHPGVFEGFQTGKLARLHALPDTAAWLLFYTTSEMQRWFEERGTPALVVGRTHEGVSLPSVYPDLPAAARHAAGLFCARGHRDLVYLIASFTSLGDRMASEAFAAEGHRLGANVRIVEHDPDVHSVARAVVRTLAERPRPTAYYCACPEHVVTALCRLQSAGIPVPDAVSIISGWDDHCLDFTYPPVSRYRVSGGRMGRRIARSILKMIHGEREPSAARAILPEFLEGATLGYAPQSLPRRLPVRAANTLD